MNYGILIADYLAGPEISRRSVSGMSGGTTREVVLHIADVDLVYADHVVRAIAESEPTLFDGDRRLFAPGLA